MAQYDDVKTPTIALVGVVGAIALVAIVFILQVIYYHVEAAQVKAKDVDQPVVELQKNIQAQQAKLVEYRWVDRAKGVVAIPIDRAMVLVVDEMGSTSHVQTEKGAASTASPTAKSAAGGKIDANK